MSWVEQIQRELIITTGDSKEYKPQWLNASKDIEYNVSEFYFPNFPGTLVARGNPKGAKFNVEFYFQGDDHLNKSEAFQESAKDKRPWILSHPFYGRLTVQPLSLKFDNSIYNISRITGTLLETITEDNPKLSIDPVDKIAADHEALMETSADSYVNSVQPVTTDVTTLTENNEAVYNLGVKKVKTNVDFENYFNAFNTANSKILDLTSKPLEAIRALQAVISMPALFADSVKNRIETLVNQFNKLRDSVSNIVRRSDKKAYENNAAVAVATVALAAVTISEDSVTPDYNSRNDVVSIIAQLIQVYDDYLEDLDTLQSENGGDMDSYIPDVITITQLSSIVSFTVSSLFSVAINARQERSIICEDDTNIILLAHRFYGLTPDDSTIDELIRNNNIGLNELLSIRKGREIVYYI